MKKDPTNATIRERYYAFIAFVVKSQPQNPGEITPELISRLIGCSVSYAYELEGERLGQSWDNIREKLSN